MKNEFFCFDSLQSPRGNKEYTGFINLMKEKFSRFDENINTFALNLFENMQNNTKYNIDFYELSSIIEETVKFSSFVKSNFKRFKDTYQNNLFLQERNQELMNKMRKIEDEMGILKEDNKQKELNCKKIEEELKLFEKENEELTIQLLQEKKHEEKRVIQRMNSQNEYSIYEEKSNILMKENNELMIKINTQDKEIKNKNSSLIEVKERLNIIEKEKNEIKMKLKIQENLTEKVKNENIYLKKENMDLRIIIQNIEKKGVDYSENNFTSEGQVLSHFQQENTPLNNLIIETEGEEDKPIVRKPSKLTIFSPKNFEYCNSLNPIKYPDYQSVKIINTESTSAPDKLKLGQNTLDELDDFIEDNQNEKQKDTFSIESIAVTSKDMVKKMSNKDKCCNKLGKKDSPIKNIQSKNGNNNTHINTESDLYKEFFHLTFLTFKLNSTDFEPFFYINPEELYTNLKKKNIPFHKFSEYIWREISRFHIDF